MNEMSFPSSFRLSERSQYQAFWGKSFVSKLGACVVFRIPNTFQHPRLGMTLKGRFSSTDRHRMKRVIREAFRTRVPRSTGYDYNVVVSAPRLSDFRFTTPLRLALEKFFSHEHS